MRTPTVRARCWLRATVNSGCALSAFSFEQGEQRSFGRPEARKRALGVCLDRAERDAPLVRLDDERMDVAVAAYGASITQSQSGGVDGSQEVAFRLSRGGRWVHGVEGLGGEHGAGPGAEHL